MKIRYVLVMFSLGLITACSSNTPPTATQSMETDQPRRVQNFVATADGPCIHRGTMYSDGATSCQSGLQFRCSNSEWVSLGVTCIEETVAVSRPCQYSGITFPTGAASCQTGTQYRCEDGSWRSLMISCSSTESPIRIVPDGRTCLLEGGGSTVANSSSVCHSGSTYLCNDGEWLNLGTLCR